MTDDNIKGEPRFEPNTRLAGCTLIFIVSSLVTTTLLFYAMQSMQLIKRR